MEIQCPNCKKTQMTKGRVEFACRYCGTMLRDPRVEDIPDLSDKYVNLAEVLKIAKNNGVYRQMRAVLDLEQREISV